MISYGEISRNRDVFFGLAILMILIFHYAEDVFHWSEDYYPIIEILSNTWLKIFASIGVDIFAFLSGMGLVYSLRKNSDIRRFYGKRFSRIVCPYVIVGGLYWIVKDFFLLQSGLSSFLKDFFFVSFFLRGARDIWYILFVLVIYMIFPWIYRVIDSKDDKEYEKRAIFMLMILFVASVSIGLIFPSILQNIEIALGRLSSFGLGVCLVPRIRKDTVVSKVDIVILAIGVCGFSLLKKLLSGTCFADLSGRWRNAFYTVLILLVVSAILKYLIHSKIILNYLKWLGKYTLEIYLIHVTIRGIFRIIGLYTGRIEIYALVVLIALLLSPLLAKCNNIIIERIVENGK